jgi:hypothetical protein
VNLPTFAPAIYGWTPDYDDRLRQLCAAIGYDLAGGARRCTDPRCLGVLRNSRHRACRRQGFISSIVSTCTEVPRLDIFDHHVWLRAAGVDQDRPHLLLVQPYGDHTDDIEALARQGLAAILLPVSPYGHGTTGYLIGAAGAVAEVVPMLATDDIEAQW